MGEQCSTVTRQTSKQKVRGGTGLSGVAPDCPVPHEDKASNGRPAPSPNDRVTWRRTGHCFILVKRGRKSKFAPKAIEGFLLGYDSNTRAYRVFNKSTGLVEVL